MFLKRDCDGAVFGDDRRSLYRQAIAAKMVRQPARVASAEINRRCAGSSSININMRVPFGVMSAPILSRRGTVYMPYGKDRLKVPS